MQTLTALRHRSRLPSWLPVLVLSTGAVSLSGQPASAPSSGARDETVQLPQFTVSGEKTDPYAPGDALSAARIRAALLDTAASISVVSADFMKDIGAESMLDATRYSSGMSAGRAAGVGGIADRHVIRGFESIDGRVVDNFQVGFQANFDPQFVERVEVIKGPNSILSPTGAPGGTMNVISKSPRFTRANSLTLAAGQRDAQKISLDSTGALPWLGKDKLAYRIVSSVQDTKSYLPGKVKLYDIQAGLTYKISATSQITFKYFGFDWTQAGAIGCANSWGIAVDPNLPAGAELYNEAPAALGFTAHGANGDTDWGTRKVRVNMVTTEYTAALTDRISLRLAGNWLSNKQGQDQGFQTVGGLGATRYNPFTGEPTPTQTWARNSAGVFVPTTSVLWDPTRIPRRAAWIQSLTQQTTFQADVAGNFKLGGLSLQPLAGASSISTIVFPNFDRSAPLPVDNLFISTDDNPAKPDRSLYTTSFKRSSHNWQGQVYTYVRLGVLDDRLFVTGGASRVWIDNFQYQWITNNAPANTLAFIKDNRDTYAAGLLAKPLPGLSVYYSYSSNAAGVNANNTALWREGKQHEFGVKADFFKQRLSVTAAHFQIIQTNLSTPNPAFNADPVNNPPNILANFTNHGYEFEVKGGLTKNLSVVGSYTTQQLRDPFGRRPRNIADRTAGALVQYRFTEGALKRLGVFAGMTRQGKTAGETASGVTALGAIQQVSFYIPAFSLINVGASYSWKNLAFNLTVDNATDHKGFWQAADRGDVPPIPARNVRMSTTITF